MKWLLLVGGGLAALFALNVKAAKDQRAAQLTIAADASTDPEEVEQAIVALRAEGYDAQADILEVHLRALREKRKVS